MSCQICLEDYKGRVKPIQCQYCPSNACSKCLEQYLLQTYEDPHCLTCKRGWTSEFMSANFTLSFRGTELRKHRRTILFEREKSFLPSMQVYVEAKKTMATSLAERNRLAACLNSQSGVSRRYTTHMTQINSKRALYVQKELQVDKMKADIRALTGTGAPAIETQAVAIMRTEFQNLRNARNALAKEYNDLRDSGKEIVKEYTDLHNAYTEENRRHYRAFAVYQGTEAPVKREFIMKCGADDCRGFLSTAYKCGTCDVWTCPECLVVIGKDKNAEHTCKPDMVESAKAIKAETQPCPKCAARIYKVDGCFAENTPILLWNGETKLSQNVSIGDELVGDDGQKRIVKDTCNGEDEMYTVTQTRGDAYTVNSKHTLALRPYNHISYRSDPMWIVKWFNGQSFSSKQFSTEEEAAIFLKGMNLPDVIEITVDDYMKLSQASKDLLYGYKVSADSKPGWFKTSIHVKAVGKAPYFGWSVDGNRRFVLPDMTVVRNCDQMWCTVEGCNTAFSWKSGHVVTGTVHNPHYYEWLRRTAGAAAPAREAGDIPCGGIPNFWTFLSAFRAARILPEESSRLELIHQNLVDFEARLGSYPARMPQLLNKEINVMYLMNTMTEAEWKRQLEFTEAKFNRKKEIGQILQTLVTAGADYMSNLVNRCNAATTPDSRIALRVWIIDTVIPELEGLRVYTNQAFKELAVRNHMAAPQISEDWVWMPIRALYRTKKVVAAVVEGAAAGAAVAAGAAGAEGDDMPPPLYVEPVEVI